MLRLRSCARSYRTPVGDEEELRARIEAQIASRRGVTSSPKRNVPERQGDSRSGRDGHGVPPDRPIEDPVEGTGSRPGVRPWRIDDAADVEPSTQSGARLPAEPSGTSADRDANAEQGSDARALDPARPWRLTNSGMAGRAPQEESGSQAGNAPSDADDGAARALQPVRPWLRRTPTPDAEPQSPTTDNNAAFHPRGAPPARRPEPRLLARDVGNTASVELTDGSNIGEPLRDAETSGEPPRRTGRLRRGIVSALSRHALDVSDRPPTDEAWVSHRERRAAQRAAAPESFVSARPEAPAPTPTVERSPENIVAPATADGPQMAGQLPADLIAEQQALLAERTALSVQRSALGSTRDAGTPSVPGVDAPPPPPPVPSVDQAPPAPSVDQASPVPSVGAMSPATADLLTEHAALLAEQAALTRQHSTPAPEVPAAPPANANLLTEHAALLAERAALTRQHTIPAPDTGAAPTAPADLLTEHAALLAEQAALVKQQSGGADASTAPSAGTDGDTPNVAPDLGGEGSEASPDVGVSPDPEPRLDGETAPQATAKPRWGRRRPAAGVHDDREEPGTVRPRHAAAFGSRVPSQPESSTDSAFGFTSQPSAPEPVTTSPAASLSQSISASSSESARGESHSESLPVQDAEEPTASVERPDSALPASGPGVDLSRRLAEAASFVPAADAYVEHDEDVRPGPVKRAIAWLLEPAAGPKDLPANAAAAEPAEDDMPTRTLPPVRPPEVEIAPDRDRGLPPWSTPRAPEPRVADPDLTTKLPRVSANAEPEAADAAQPADRDRRAAISRASEDQQAAEPPVQDGPDPQTPGTDLARRLATANASALARSDSLPPVQPAPAEDDVEPRRRRTPLPRWLPSVRTVGRLLVGVVIAVVAALLLRTYVVAPYYIPSASMEPTLHGCQGCNNDHVLVDKLSYKTHDLRRGDVVVFRKPDAWQVSDKVIIKRVIGLPGDVLSERSGIVYVNGLALEEPYLDPDCKNGTTDFPKASVTVADGQAFVMGDNRCDSSDSRRFGAISDSAVIGRAFVIIWPLGRIHWL